MKKSIAVLLAVLVLLSVFACGKAAKEEAGQASTDAFETVVIADNNQCVVKIVGMERDPYFGNTLNVYMENKSLTKTYDFSVMEAYVNGVAWSPFYIKEVGPRKNETEKMQFVSDSLDERIPEFTDIELIFRVSDSNDSKAEDVVHETVHVYPLGKDKAKPYVHEAKSSDFVMEDNKDFSAIVTGYPTDEAGGLITELFLANKTDAKLIFWIANVTVNGKEIDPFWAQGLNEGKMVYSKIFFTQSDFDKLGIKEVESIRLTLCVMDYDMTGSFVYEKDFTLTP